MKLRSPKALLRPAEIAGIRDFPAFEGARRHALELVTRGADDHEVSDFVLSDVALVITTFRVCREAGGEACNLADAIAEVPRHALAEAIAALPVFDMRATLGHPLAPGPFVAHAAAVQRAVRDLERKLERRPAGELQTAAMLHDVGKLVLRVRDSTYAPDRDRPPEARVEAERRAYGLDHAVAGEEALLSLSIPEPLAGIVGSHHSDGPDDGAALLRVADMLVNYQSGFQVDVEALSRAAERVGLQSAGLGELMFDSTPALSPISAAPCPLTNREFEVLHAMGGAGSYKGIAAELGISVATVRVHAHHIYAKLDVPDRAQAVLTATRRGWI